MIGISDQAAIDRIAVLESEIAQLRVALHLRSAIPQPPDDRPIRSMVSTAAVLFSVPTAAILGATREARVVRARFAVIWTAREVLGFSLTRIGAALGNRDHTTVLSGIRRCEQMRAQCDDYRHLTDVLVGMFQPKSKRMIDDGAIAA